MSATFAWTFLSTSVGAASEQGRREGGKDLTLSQEVDTLQDKGIIWGLTPFSKLLIEPFCSQGGEINPLHMHAGDNTMPCTFTVIFIYNANHLLSKSTKKSTFGTGLLSFNTRRRFPIIVPN